MKIRHRFYIFLILFFGISTVSTSFGQDPENPDILLNICNVCSTYKLPVKCVFSPDENASCSGVDPEWTQTHPDDPNEYLVCRGTGAQKLTHDLWMRRVRFVDAGETGEECETWKRKPCILAKECKLRDDEPDAPPRCVDGDWWVYVKYDTDMYTHGDSCPQAPGGDGPINPVEGGPFGP